MTRARDIACLKELADLVRDQRLAQLRKAALRCAQSRMQIAALDRDATELDLPVVASGQVALRYQAWADVRRGELNAVLARQTADWLTARDEARTAFGRAEALSAILERADARKASRGPNG